jgi:hypothetical protein
VPWAVVAGGAGFGVAHLLIQLLFSDGVVLSVAMHTIVMGFAVGLALSALLRFELGGRHGRTWLLRALGAAAALAIAELVTNALGIRTAPALVIVRDYGLCGTLEVLEPWRQLTRAFDCRRGVEAVLVGAVLAFGASLGMHLAARRLVWEAGKGR